jgi:hypothetical protein
MTAEHAARRVAATRPGSGSSIGVPNPEGVFPSAIPLPGVDRSGLGLPARVVKASVGFCSPRYSAIGATRARSSRVPRFSGCSP